MKRERSEGREEKGGKVKGEGGGRRGKLKEREGKGERQRKVR